MIVRTSSGDLCTAHLNFIQSKKQLGTGEGGQKHRRVASVFKRGAPASLIRSLPRSGKSHRAGDRPFSVYLALKHATEGYES